MVSSLASLARRKKMTYFKLVWLDFDGSCVDSKFQLPGGLGLFDCCSLCWPQGECYKPRRLRRTLTAALTSTEANLDDKFPAKARPRGLLIHQKSFYDFILTTFGLEQSTNFEPTYQQNPQQNQMTYCLEKSLKMSHSLIYNVAREFISIFAPKINKWNWFLNLT